MRMNLWRLAGCCLASLRGRPGGGFLRGALLLLTAIAGVGLALAGDSATGETREYSVYEDHDKPAISLILSEERNVKEF